MKRSRTGKTPSRARKAPAPATDAERRVNRELREVLDELVDHVRHVARNVRDLSPEELRYAQERLEWLADEIFRSAAERGGPPPA